MEVLAVQINMAWEDKAATIARVRRLLATVEVAAGSLIVLPEMFATGFSMNVAAIAEGEDRQAEAFLRQLAMEKRCAVLGGVVNRSDDGRGLNEAVVYGPDGAEIARYAKMHPFSYAGEDQHFAAGERVITFHWGGFRVAPLICYDLRFPEVYREAARQGAEVLVTIASFPASREHHWVTLNIARAIENQAYVIAVNRVGQDPKTTYSGRSLIIGPRGETLVDAGDGEGVVTARLDPEILRSYRGTFPALADMRPDLAPGAGRATAPPAFSGSAYPS